MYVNVSTKICQWEIVKYKEYKTRAKYKCELVSFLGSDSSREGAQLDTISLSLGGLGDE